MSGQRPNRSPGKLLFPSSCCRRGARVKKLCHPSASAEVRFTFIYSATCLPAMPPTPLWQGAPWSLHCQILFICEPPWDLALWVIPMFLQFPFTHPTWCHDPISFSGSWISILLPPANQSFLPLSSGSPCPNTISAAHVSSDDTLVPNFCPALFSTTSPAHSTRILCSIWPNLISLSSLQALPVSNFPLFMNRTTVPSHNLDKKESPPTVRFLLEPQWQSITSYGFSLWHSMPSHVPFLTLLLQIILLLCLDFSGLLTGFIPFVYTMLTLVIHTNVMTRTIWSLQSRHTESSWTVPRVPVSAV